MKPKSHYCCRPGLNAAPKNSRKELRSGLRVIFGMPKRSFFYERIADYPDMPYDVKVNIDKLFLDVPGLQPEDVWRVWYD